MSNQGSKSTVAQHPQVATIRLALANAVSLHRIAQTYGLSRDALWRYKKTMRPEELAMLRYRTDASPLDLERLRKSESELLVQRIVVMLSEIYAAWRLAIEHEDFRSAASLAAQHHRYLDLQAQLLGDLITGDRHLHVAITEAPEYRRLVAMVMTWITAQGERAADLSAQLAQFLEEQEMQAKLGARANNGNGHDGAHADPG